MAVLTQKRLKHLLSYDPEIGEFTWIRPTSNRVKKGDIAASAHNCGYHAIRIDTKAYLAHRLAWLYVHGTWPTEEIDHINQVRSDNRISNLRVAERSVNSRNQVLRKNNTSGVLGVCWDKSRNKWASRIKVNYKTINLGRHGSLLDAVAARKSAENKYGFHENHGLLPAHV